MPPIQLAGGDGFLITLHPAPRTPHPAPKGPDEVLVITFGGQPSGIASSGFGTGWCLQYGWDTIYVAQKHGTQYQQLDLKSFAEAVLPVADGRDIVCYGSSLGAYAAIYFAGAIDARVIAAAPMLPAWPPLGRDADAIPLLHQPLSAAPKTTRSPIVLYDPMVPADRKMIDQMIRPAYPNGRYVELEFAGHTVLQSLNRSKLLKPFIIGAIERDEVIEINRDVEQDPLWHYQKGRHVSKSEPALARHHFERSLELAPSRHTAANLLVTLMRLGDRVAAQAVLDEYREHPDHPLPEPTLTRARAFGLTA